MHIDRLTTPWWALRAGLGAAAFLAGLDKFFNLLADWPGYLSPIVAHLLPLSPTSFMHVIGVVEMLVGAAILAGCTQLGGYVAAAWLGGIAINLVERDGPVDQRRRHVRLVPLDGRQLLRSRDRKAVGWMGECGLECGGDCRAVAGVARYAQS